VRERQPFGGPLFVSFEGREHAIGGELAGAMRVEIDSSLVAAVATDIQQARAGG